MRELEELKQKARRAEYLTLSSVCSNTLAIGREYPGKHNIDEMASRVLLKCLNRLDDLD